MRLVPRYHCSKQVYGTLVCVECRYYATLAQDLLDVHLKNEVREVFYKLQNTLLLQEQKKSFKV